MEPEKKECELYGTVEILEKIRGKTSLHQRKYGTGGKATYRDGEDTFKKYLKIQILYIVHFV